MSKKSKKAKKIAKYKALYHETRNYLDDALAEIRSNERELYYLWEFISYNKLEADFEYFKDNAHEQYDEDMPFSYLTLD